MSSHQPTQAQIESLLSLGEDYMSRGELDPAASLAQLAAFCSFRFCGTFVSPRLESLVLALGRKMHPPGDSPTVPVTGKQERVLHVVTHARPIGGDSRYVWRWIMQDPLREHSMVVTHQEAVDERRQVPDVFKEAVEASGGSVYALFASGSQPIQKALQLRELCQKSDYVVLHLFPYDIIPLLALAAGCEKVKTIFVHHSDHTFWAGAGVADLIVHLRAQSPGFLSEKRGLNPGISALLPIPVPSPNQVEKDEAKRKLGYEVGTIILLTIATKFKYRVAGELSFLDLVVPVVKKFPQVILVAIGPEPDEHWVRASLETNGRITALGARWDTSTFYSAADIYLDSVPFSSNTSLLEAGSYGLPLLGLRAKSGLELLGAGAPGLEGVMELSGDAESYQLELARLISDSRHRLALGERTMNRIKSTHMGAGWNSALHSVYQALLLAPPRSCLVATRDIFEVGPLCLALRNLYRSVIFRPRLLVRENFEGLPYWKRVSITCRLVEFGFPLCHLNLLPSPFDSLLHTAGRWIKAKLVSWGEWIKKAKQQKPVFVKEPYILGVSSSPKS